MSEIEQAREKIALWSAPLADDSAPCGPDLEYDNDFLTLSRAAAGKPESQFGPAEPPAWREVMELSEALLERSRDLRIAILWMRSLVHLQGYASLAPGLELLRSMIEALWDHVHPLPDPDDGDPYARVNALTLLREVEGLIGDLREARLIEDRSIGLVTGRHVEVALGLSPAREGEDVLSTAALSQMAAAAEAKRPGLRAACEAAQEQLKALRTLLLDKLGHELAPDLRPLQSLVQGVFGTFPAEVHDPAGASDTSDDGEQSMSSGVRTQERGLSGSVNSREDALKAIAMVCEYLERVEPSNPAPLFLRRGSELINQNFLQLVKMLAPDALAGVAGLVGIDPYNTDNS